MNQTDLCLLCSYALLCYEVSPLSLATSAASSAAELQQAIADAAAARLGRRAVPVEWLDGGMETMVVQYLGAGGEPRTLRSDSDFALVLGSRNLRVTRRRR